MLTTEYFADLMKRVGEWARAKGWNDKPRSDDEWAVLLVTELAESYEEYRGGRMDLWFKKNGNLKFHVPHDTVLAAYNGTLDPTEFSVTNEGIIADYKPEGFWVEMADVIIRMAHEASVNGQEVNLKGYIHFACTNVSQAIRSMIQVASRNDRDVRSLMYLILDWADQCRVDLVPLIEMKMKYNATREHRHGGKVA